MKEKIFGNNLESFYLYISGGRYIRRPDITPNSTYCRYFGLGQKFAYISRNGRYFVASGKLCTNHRKIAMTSNSRKRKRLSLQERLESFKMLESGNVPSALTYKFGISSRSIRDFKSQGSALFEEARITPIIFNLSPCAEANIQRFKRRLLLRRTREIL